MFLHAVSDFVLDKTSDLLNLSYPNVLINTYLIIIIRSPFNIEFNSVRGSTGNFSIKGIY